MSSKSSLNHKQEEDAKTSSHNDDQLIDVQSVIDLVIEESIENFNLKSKQLEEKCIVEKRPTEFFLEELSLLEKKIRNNTQEKVDKILREIIKEDLQSIK
ncbi:Uncharacterised protein [uncultured archaeon]|nr:Uncharacterised protein [uncultured archaeon]